MRLSAACDLWLICCWDCIVALPVVALLLVALAARLSIIDDMIIARNAHVVFNTTYCGIADCMLLYLILCCVVMRNVLCGYDVIKNSNDYYYCLYNILNKMYTISNILVVHHAQWQFRHNSHNLRYSPTIPPKKFCTKMDSIPKNLLINRLSPSRSQDNFDNKSLILSYKNVQLITL